MNFRFVIVAAALSLAGVMPAAAQKASLEETMEWIAGRLQTNTCDVLYDGNYKITVNSQTLNGTNSAANTYEVSQTLENHYQSGIVESEDQRFTFSLADIESAVVQGVSAEGSSCITLRLDSLGTPSVRSNSGSMQWNFGIYISSESMANRIKSAFEHAISLAKAAEPF
jgi:hypothetical protein